MFIVSCWNSGDTISMYMYSNKTYWFCTGEEFVIEELMGGQKEREENY